MKEVTKVTKSPVKKVVKRVAKKSPRDIALENYLSSNMSIWAMYKFNT